MEEELDLKELLLIFWKKKVIIIVITLISIIVGALYSYLFKKPIYKASTKLALVQKQIETTENSDKINKNKLLLTSTEIIKSDIILKDVVNSLDIEGLTENNIKSTITVENIKDTDIIEITVKNVNADVPAQVANKIAEIFSKKIGQMYNDFGNVYIIEEAKTESTPFNINHKKDILIFTFIGLVIFAGTILISTMYTKQDNKG